MNNLDYSKVFEVLVKETANYVKVNNLKAMVLGISGGIDSTVVAAICHEVSKQTGIPLIGRSLPIKNKSDEFDVSKLVGEALCNDFKVYKLERSYRAALFDACADAGDVNIANAETYQTAGRMDLSAVEADEAEILEELLPKEPTKEELNAALLKLALDKGWYDDNEEHDIHPVQIPKNQMGIAVKELKAKYPAADGKKIADLVKANLCN